MRIRCIRTAFPDAVLDNDKLAELYPAWPADKILEKTGVRQRRVVASGETAVDLAERATRSLLMEDGVDPKTIGFTLLCTQSPDYYLPTSACLLQDRLGLSKSSGALDFNLGCSGFVYGLALAKGLIAGGMAERVLLLTAETYSRFIHPMDKSVRTIFGDAAAATLIEKSEDDGIGEFVLGTDGSGYANLIVPAGGARRPADTSTALEECDESGNIRSKNDIFMNGPEIFNFTLEIVPQTVQAALDKNGLLKENIDLFVFHQANRFMLEVLRKAVRIPREKFYVNMEDIGNTVSATIPIALSRAQADGTLKSGMKVMLVGFGVGLSWGATVITW